MSALCESEVECASQRAASQVRVLAGQWHISRPGKLAVAKRHAAELSVRQSDAAAQAIPPRVLREAASPSARRISRESATPLRRPPAALRPAPLRLTRRGRRVAATLAVGAATLALVLGWLVLASGAQAADHGVPGAGHAGMARVVVQPGQTLWAIAAAADPGADPRAVVAEIMQVNALSTAAIQPGEQLWVPKS
jgi:LysM domain